jgi:hypothetical protein
MTVTVTAGIDDARVRVGDVAEGWFYGMYREQRGDEKEGRSEEEIRTKKKKR